LAQERDAPLQTSTLPHAIRCPSAEKPTSGPGVLRIYLDGLGEISNSQGIDVKKAGQVVASIDLSAGGGTAHRSYSFTSDGQIISGGKQSRLHLRG
jgi:hypothetical protein